MERRKKYFQDPYFSEDDRIYGNSNCTQDKEVFWAKPGHAEFKLKGWGL